VRAAVFTGVRQPLAVEELEIDPPAAGEVAVRVEASGVCHSDLHVVEGEWEETPPMVLGHEGCGVVDAVGEGVAGVAVGDRVVLSWYAPCGRCRYCAEGREWICTGTRADSHLMPDGGVRLRREGGERVLPYLATGSFAERTVMPASGVVSIDPALPAEVGALIGCAVTTGVGAVVNTAAVRPGASVAVLGCGGVGLSCVMGAALAGADPIVAVDRNDGKLDLARDVGATHAVRAGSGTRAEIREIVPGGPDYVFEAIGLAETIELSLRLVARGGAAVLVGMPPTGTAARIDPLRLSVDGVSVLGCTYGSARPRDMFSRLARLALSGRLPVDRLIDSRIGLDQIDEAFERMRRGEGARSVVIP
jgi:S-(hydroxymethyl)glutathione dehydrogenase / alcohol dehydrogenase